MAKDIIPYTNIKENPITPENKDIGTFMIGAGKMSLRIDYQGLWLGSEKYEDAPFRVSMEGSVLASDIILNGYLQNGSAAGDINANATTISGSKITTGSISASKMNVTSLSAISANIGDITAGSLTGIMIRSSASGQRVEINSSMIQLFNSGGSNVSSIYGYSSGSYFSTTGIAFINGSEEVAISANGSLGLYVSPNEVVSNKRFIANNGITLGGETKYSWPGGATSGDIANLQSQINSLASSVSSLASLIDYYH